MMLSRCHRRRVLNLRSLPSIGLAKWLTCPRSFSPAPVATEVVSFRWPQNLLKYNSKTIKNKHLRLFFVFPQWVYFDPQGSASEATLLCLLVARERFARHLQEKNPQITEADLRSAKAKLVAYASGMKITTINFNHYSRQLLIAHWNKGGVCNN